MECQGEEAKSSLALASSLTHVASVSIPSDRRPGCPGLEFPGLWVMSDWVGGDCANEGESGREDCDGFHCCRSDEC